MGHDHLHTIAGYTILERLEGNAHATLYRAARGWKLGRW
jgi:hypothetical protein